MAGYATSKEHQKKNDKSNHSFVHRDVWVEHYRAFNYHQATRAKNRGNDTSAGYYSGTQALELKCESCSCGKHILWAKITKDVYFMVSFHTIFS